MAYSVPPPFNSQNARKSVSNVSTYHQSRSTAVDTTERNIYPNSGERRGRSLDLTSKSAPASRTSSLINTAGLRSLGKRTLSNSSNTKRASTAKQPVDLHSPLPSKTIVFDTDGRTLQAHQARHFDSQLITNLTSDRSWRAKEPLKCPVNQLPKIKTPCIPLSETKGSYKNTLASKSNSVIISGNSKNRAVERKSTFPVVGKGRGDVKKRTTLLGNRVLSQSSRERSEVRKCRSEVKSFINDPCQKGGGREKRHESDKMKTARSELSLLEQKRLQWAKEREELNGLWSPWGRQSEAIETRVSPSIQMQASYPSPTNVVSSSYMANLGSGPSPLLYSQSHSECYLPPINSTIAQQPRQKAKVWNAEFQPEDYKYENDNSATSSSQNSHRYSVSHPHRNVGVLQPRKASLPNYMYDSGENYHQQNLHQATLVQHNNTHNHEGGADNINHHQQQHVWGSSPIMDEDAFTSGYYSENNNNNTDDGKTTSRKHQEVVLKPTSRERSYQEEVTVQKAIAVRGENNVSPRVIMHKIYTQNGEMFLQHDGNQEIIVNSMTVSLDEGNRTPTGNFMSDQQHNSQQEHSRSPGGRLPRNHAMRSSLTIGVDASSVDAYNDLERREKQQWLNELDKQREEQRLRKMMEKEERRPRWGDRGIGVGHFWEPAESENSHLPAPPHSSRGKYTLSSRAESEGVMGGGDGDVYSPSPSYHPTHSHTPPAWLERSLTRMQSSKSQPSLHDPDYTNDLENTNDGMSEQVKASKSSHQLLSSSRSLNHSTSDLIAFNSQPGDILDRTYLRGHNVPIDPDTFNERERKRQANQEHLEALKKQIEAKQQQQKEEKELRLQEEREQEIRIAKQREIELQRLEREKRGKMPVHGDMPNSVEDTTPQAPENGDSSNVHPKHNKNANIPVHDPEEEKDIKIVQRQSVLVTTAPTIEDDDKTTESSDALPNHHRPRLSRQDQSVMTDMSDPTFERTLTPSFQRSRSLSLCRSNREFGTQTELSDGSTSSGSSSESGKNCDKNRSHNSLLDKKAKEKKQLEKKPEERPRWGSNPVKKLYVKQSEKDPNYVNRMKRRQERLKRMEEERCVRVDTGTESEDVSIPFHRIRQRRNEASPQRRMSRGVTPMKAIAFQKTENSSRLMTASSSETAPQEQQQQQQKIVDNRNKHTNSKQDSIKDRKTVHSQRAGEDPALPPTLPHSHAMKNAKSETHLNKRQTTADIIDRNFGSVAGINVLSGTSEESSGFSTPFPQRRDIGSGSTGSGTTGSGSGVQSPDLTYHTYQANKSTREERKYAKITNGRDTHSVSGNLSKGSGESSTVESSKTSIVASAATNVTAGKEFGKGFIPQRDFDEMPVKAGQGNSIIGDVGNDPFEVVPGVTSGSPVKKKLASKMSSPTRGRAMTLSNNKNASPVREKQQRNKSTSPQRKPRSPVKAKNSINSRHKGKSTTNLTQTSIKSEEINLPNIPQDLARPTSPPVPALLKKMQMGLQPDESGRISSLPTEFPDILAPLPTIPIGLLSPNPSRLSSATSGTSSAGKIDIDIAVTPRSNPEIVRLFEAAEERIKQRQLSAIMAGNNGKLDNDSGKSRTSFEADIGRISINLEPVMLFANGHHNGGGLDQTELEVEVPTSARLSIRSQPISPRPPPTPRDSTLHEAFITSILNSKEVKEQLSARESELSEKGIIEFSIRLPSTSSGDEFIDEYKDPLLTERRRHTAQWLYGGQNVPQKQAILTNLASLKKGIALQQQEWQIGVGASDTE